MSLMVPMLRYDYLILLMVGLMEVLFLTRSPVSRLRVRGSMLIFLARVGGLAGGDTLMTSVASALYQVLFRLYREQSSGILLALQASEAG